METIKDRLIKFLAYLKIGQGKFEKNCGLSNGTVNNIKEGGITTQKVEKILLAYPNLNIDWLITGRGEMEKHPSEIISEDNINTNDMDRTILETLSNLNGQIRDLKAKVNRLESENAELRRKYEPSEERPGA